MRVSHDGKAENVYPTKESAFEAAGAATSLALRQGNEVRILALGHSSATGLQTRVDLTAADRSPGGEGGRHGLLAAQVADIYPAAALGAAHVIVRRVDR